MPDSLQDDKPSQTIGSDTTVGKLIPRQASTRTSMERRNKQVIRQQDFNEVGQNPCLRPRRVSIFTMRELHKYKIHHSSLYPTRALVPKRIPLVHPLSTLEDHSTPRAIHTLEHATQKKPQELYTLLNTQPLEETPRAIHALEYTTPPIFYILKILGVNPLLLVVIFFSCCTLSLTWMDA